MKQIVNAQFCYFFNLLASLSEFLFLTVIEPLLKDLLDFRGGQPLHRQNEREGKLFSIGIIKPGKMLLIRFR